MPIRVHSPCSVAGCPEIAVSGGRCAQHQQRRQYVDTRLSASKRGYDAKWRKSRARFLSVHPVCVVCGGEATEVDHIIPLSAGGDDDWRNLQPLCKRCHSRKTRRQAPG